MVWRSHTTTQDRFFACLVYLLPLIRAYTLLYWGVNLGGSVFARSIISFWAQYLPFLDLVLFPIDLVAGFYLSITRVIAPFGLGDFLVFIVLIVAVVRNESIRHFVRFNTMQAILVGIALSLFAIVWQGLVLPITQPLRFDLSPLTLLVGSGLFLGTAAICVYSMIQSATGKYAEIPTISDIVYGQVP
ncbi:MAG: Tic20 family protein [Leptolyngbyaceae cyanobacterium]